MSLTYRRIPRLSCDWPSCETFSEGRHGERANDIRKVIENKGWTADMHTGRDFCPEHSKPHASLIPSFTNSAWCDFARGEQVGLDYMRVCLLAGAARGLSNEDIAAQVGLTVNGVKSSWKRVFEIMGVHERAAAVAIAYDLQILRPLAERIAKAERRSLLQVAS